MVEGTFTVISNARRRLHPLKVRRSSEIPAGFRIRFSQNLGYAECGHPFGCAIQNEQA